ncbi:hypothetical protein GCM10011529_29750 [Polymorphobacter glacialis]|uniref:LysM domain-containing protein n=1 Tax=Sandarakinorhabdus glacialis TaxID=1614636 RepID=A0A917EDA5_9SPHN|nr:M23 family metallopeptidase [Polymorphobacter glacialis]GGE21170.1 hypothetical protein GCM10011529_29750 [Polymorphobacter glacialis]
MSPRRLPCAPVPGILLGALLALGACAGDKRDAARSPAPPKTATKAAAPARPAWQARRVVPDAIVTPQGRLHTVKSGETGISIARAYGVSWEGVAASNRLKPPYVLEVGDKLLLPSARQAAAQVAAMSLEDRAKAFDLTIDDIVTGGEPAERPATYPPNPKPGAIPAGQRPATSPQRTASLPAIPANPRANGESLFHWPVDGRIVSGFGAKPGGRFNDGVNLKASAGSPVRAAADGVVAYAGDAIPGFGNLVLVKHAGDYVTAYAHNENLLVTRGKRVSQGDVLARVGSTGAVTEPQVHFEIRKGRTPIDPVKVIGGR